ncbi:MAG: MBL fold metallo-hydrolase [Candidatus Aminicenantes bacterium]|nr:MBL fold metallo-hydrolase [Candidatus Aminicenantes bacterium]
MKYFFLFFLTGVFVLSAFFSLKAEGNIRVTILYDNTAFAEGTKPDWGFSCLIEGTEKTILFDTGTRSTILLDNIKILKADMSRVDQVVISHNHGDHTGGLSAFLEINHDVTVFLPFSFHDSYAGRIKEMKAQSKPVSEPVEICSDVYSTGELGESVKEQSLVLDTSRGIVVITGCSHPGIVDILKKAKEILNKNIYLVFGGFHLMNKSDAEMKAIIDDFKKLGVEKVGATHCTGPKQIDMFRKEWGENFVEMGVGRVITFDK